MGNTPSQPTDEQVEELKEKRNQMIEAAAAAIATADVLLVTTGAGWSADSGLAVYKDVANVPAYHKRELTYHALCQPAVLDEDPALFHGFWGGCFNDYREATLSPGYALVAGWCDRRFRGTPTSEELAELIRADPPEPKRYPLLEARELARAQAAAIAAGKEVPAELPAANAAAARATPLPERGASAFFSFTSNVDAHWTTVCRPGELRECHGNTETWQCTDPCCAAALETEARASGPSPVAGGRWRAPPSFRFHVDEETREAPDGPALAGSAGVGSGQPHDAEAFAHNWPRCVRCGGKARPSVLMFGDAQWQDDKQQQAGWESWRTQLMALAAARASTAAADGKATGEPGVGAPPAAAKPPSARPLRVVIMEAGAGGNVTTVRGTSESVLEDLHKHGAHATLVRINPELPLADDRALQPHTISLLSRGLDAVARIDARLHALHARRAELHWTAAGVALVQPYAAMLSHPKAGAPLTAAQRAAVEGIMDLGTFVTQGAVVARDGAPAAAAAAAAAWRAMAVDEAEAAVPQLDTVPPPEPEEEAEQDDEAHRMQAVAERLQAAKKRGDNDVFKQFDQINSALAELQRAMK